MKFKTLTIVSTVAILGGVFLSDTRSLVSTYYDDMSEQLTVMKSARVEGESAKAVNNEYSKGHRHPIFISDAHGNVIGSTLVRDRYKSTISFTNKNDFNHFSINAPPKLCKKAPDKNKWKVQWDKSQCKNGQLYAVIKD